MNLVDGGVEAGGVRIGSTFIPVANGRLTALGAPVTVGLRAESLELVAPGDGIPATVSIVEELGPEAFVHAHLANAGNGGLSANADIIARVEPRDAPGKGELIHLQVKDGSMLFFDAATGQRIR